MENTETQQVEIHPQREAVQNIVTSIAKSFPEVAEMEDHEMAQFLVDVIVATTFMAKEGGSMALDDIVEVSTLTYKVLDGYNGVAQ